MRTLQEWMGHAHLQTTEIYAHYAPQPREKEWVEQAFGGQSGQTQKPGPHGANGSQPLAPAGESEEGGA